MERLIVLPTVKDPDLGDSYSIILDKCLNFFCQLNGNTLYLQNYVFTSKSTTTYLVKITLTDNNPSPKSSTYTLKVTLEVPPKVIPQVPSNSTKAPPIIQQAKIRLINVDRNAKATIQIYDCNQEAKIIKLIKELNVTIVTQGNLMVNYTILKDSPALNQLQIKLNTSGIKLSETQVMFRNLTIIQELDVLKLRITETIVYQDKMYRITLSSDEESTTVIAPQLSECKYYILSNNFR
ncbi:hypothetical protein FGO68_gene7050 [Halteria grandinella]|uniref:Cadherin domain-containing protein n=1 Tax=Halteria grandinella TaxID=5974 RepID=A0A8J8P292_HALGN|nr:hypothetical protein FGO68_gene7050 [Halteria grandinella]